MDEMKNEKNKKKNNRNLIAVFKIAVLLYLLF